MTSRANSTDSIHPSELSELSRATTAYHEAAPDSIEDAREQYLEALRNFQAAQGDADSGMPEFEL